MKNKLFSLVNRTEGNSVDGVFLAANGGLAIRDNLPSLKRILPYVLDDCFIREEGYFDADGKFVPNSETPEIPWDAYKFPENPVSPLTDEQKNSLVKQ